MDAEARARAEAEAARRTAEAAARRQRFSAYLASGAAELASRLEMEEQIVRDAGDEEEEERRRARREQEEQALRGAVRGEEERLRRLRREQEELEELEEEVLREAGAAVKPAMEQGGDRRRAAGRGGSGPAQTQAEELARITMCPVHACLDALRACGGDEDQAIDRLIAMDLMSF